MSTAEAGPETPPRKEKALTIGAVAKQLEREFPDISISKIRYLEDQKLLSPRRTAGGYRLYAPADVDRLRTILRLQRDEFLPLRVIRQELASGRADTEVATPDAPAETRGGARRSFALRGPGSLYRLSEVLEETGADQALVKELEDFGVIKGERRDGEVFYDDTEREIVRAVGELKRFGAGARICSRSAASRSAEVRKTRRLRPPTPKRFSSPTARMISRSVSS